MATKTNKILITGDITLDHYIGLGDRKFSDSPKDKRGSCSFQIKGGAYLIRDFLTAFTDPKSIDFGLDKRLFTRLPSQNQSFATISMCKEGKDGKEEIWRIDQQFGFGSFTRSLDYSGSILTTDFSKYDMVILDDAGMDFGSHVNEKIAWPVLESLKKPSGSGKGVGLVICKKSGDLSKGELWKELLNASSEGKINLLTIVSVNDIRRQDARISTKISWEQSALDLTYEISNNINLKDLQKSKYLVVTFQSSGAVFIINNGNGSYEYRLVFDPRYLEDEWEEKRKGSVIGRMSCFTAVLAAKLDLNNPGKNYQLGDAIISGLQTIRGLFDVGYLYGNKEFKLNIKNIRKASEKHANTFSMTNIPSPGNNRDYLENSWTILADDYKTEEGLTNNPDKPLYDIARNIVLNGRHVLNNIPSVNFRKLFSVDRNEIESLRNLKRLIQNYKEQKSANNPLSIAVFGLPGSGKSFGVKEIGKGVLGNEVPILEFNLSQFSGSADLIGAFHQVRDEVLKGTTPLVFWDEFDSKKYEWLQYLLAPMQDGTFQEGQATHTIGKCVMVFAGGTSYKMETFGMFNETTEKENYDDFKLKKGPDFISRIHGFINILGPNPGLIINDETGKWETDLSDICYPVRRALFIRQLLNLKDDEPLEIDWGLLNALLKVKKYKHGARSLANLLKNLKDNSNGRRILRCHLPSNTILRLYIENLDDFFSHLNENKSYHENAYVIAPAIHKAWTKNAKTKNPDYVKEFNLLPVFIKASNTEAAIRIPKVLGHAKLKIVSKSEYLTMTEKEYTDYIKADKNRYLELMSEEEHRLWMDFYLKNDWKFSENRNDYQKLHNCLVDYHDKRLSEADRDKDRDQVKKYHEILDSVGFGIVKE
jgi:hypothetical protein